MNSSNENYLESMVNMGQPVQDVGPDTGRQEAILALNCLEQDGPMLLRTLDEQIEQLQEDFVTGLRTQMPEEQLGLGERLHLCLSAEGKMLVDGADSDVEKVSNVLANRPELQNTFRELAKLSLLSHGIDVACQAQAALRDADAEGNSVMFSHYHACLKGQLSHFYVR